MPSLVDAALKAGIYDGEINIRNRTNEDGEKVTREEDSR